MATGGADAIAICQRELPDLLLLDVVMDDIGGNEVCRLLKADPITSAIPVVFIASQSKEADEIMGLRLGAVDFITKPFNPVIVRARASTHLTLKLQGDLLQANALLDGLTGVGNRGRFDGDLQKNWYVGEEFPCLLPITEIEGAAAIAEAMQIHVRELHIEHAGSDISPFVTISPDVSTAAPPTDAGAAGLIQADCTRC